MDDRTNLAEWRRRAACEPGAVLLENSLGTGPGLFFCEPVEWLEAHSLSEVKPLLARLGHAGSAGLWAAGYLAYECGFALEPRAAAAAQPQDDLPLAAFGLYREPLALPGGAVAASRARVSGAELGIGEAEFAAKVERIRSWIAAGDTYQVNLTDQLTGQLEGEADALFAAMMEAQPVEYGALLRVGDAVVLSASPELFFRLRGGVLTVRPMKGTAPRGSSRAEDDERAAALALDAKNRAENVMIVDLMRSDVGRIAQMGGVRVERLFEVERFPTLLQMSSTVTARLRPGLGPAEVFGSLFPSGSVTGAPKVRTMQLIGELEQRARGVYTGAIGYWGPRGEACFSVAIRTAVLRGRALRMGVGCGITYDSDPAAEYAECRLKGRFLEDGPLRLIETMRCEAGRVELLALHLDRLEASAAELGFAFARAAAEEQLRAWAAAQPEGACKLRLELDRWGGLHLGVPEPVLAQPEPLRVMVGTVRVDAADPLLRHKTTRRGVYDRALAEARAAGCHETLLRNERGELTEGAVHTLLVRHGGVWRTPPVSAGALPGVMRRHLLRTLPGLREDAVLPEELATADEICLANAVRGVRAAVLVRGAT